MATYLNAYLATLYIWSALPLADYDLDYFNWPFESNIHAYFNDFIYYILCFYFFILPILIYISLISIFIIYKLIQFYDLAHVILCMNDNFEKPFYCLFNFLSRLIFLWSLIYCPILSISPQSSQKCKKSVKMIKVITAKPKNPLYFSTFFTPNIKRSLNQFTNWSNNNCKAFSKSILKIKKAPYFTKSWPILCIKHFMRNSSIPFTIIETTTISFW